MLDGVTRMRLFIVAPWSNTHSRGLIDAYRLVAFCSVKFVRMIHIIENVERRMMYIRTRAPYIDQLFWRHVVSCRTDILSWY